MNSKKGSKVLSSVYASRTKFKLSKYPHMESRLERISYNEMVERWIFNNSDGHLSMMIGTIIQATKVFCFYDKTKTGTAWRQELIEKYENKTTSYDKRNQWIMAWGVAASVYEGEERKEEKRDSQVKSNKKMSNAADSCRLLNWWLEQEPQIVIARALVSLPWAVH